MDMFTAAQYLKIDIANSYGLDKLSWNLRIKWFDDNEPNLSQLMPQAENQPLFYAGLQAWADYKKGIPSGYPISLDATASGFQILAALTGDRNAAEICNVVDVGIRQDAYTVIYQRMLAKTEGKAKIQRDDVKRAVMTSAYGSEAVPKEVFGTGSLYHTFLETMLESAPGVWEFNKAALDLWDPTWTSYGWTMPDNFHVKSKVMSQVSEVVNFFDAPYDITRTVQAPIKEGRSLAANITHATDGYIVREMSRRCMYKEESVLRCIFALESDADEYDMIDDDDHKMVEILMNQFHLSGVMSARILDHLKVTNVYLVNKEVIWELINSLPEKPFDILAVHDCFRCLPAYGNDLRMQYNIQLAELAESDLLSTMLSELVGWNVTVSKLDDSLGTDVLDSNYSLS